MKRNLLAITTAVAVLALATAIFAVSSRSFGAEGGTAVPANTNALIGIWVGDGGLCLVVSHVEGNTFRYQSLGHTNHGPLDSIGFIYPNGEIQCFTLDAAGGVFTARLADNDTLSGKLKFFSLFPHSQGQWPRGEWDEMDFIYTRATPSSAHAPVSQPSVIGRPIDISPVAK